LLLRQKRQSLGHPMGRLVMNQLAVQEHFPLLGGKDAAQQP
jgi:hypothetical protein